MIELLFSSPKLLGAIAGIGALLAAGLGLFFKGIAKGKADEQAKRMKEQLAAKEERLEMHREATAAEREAAGMTDDEARKEAEKWAQDQ